VLLDAAAGGREEEELEMFNAKQITRMRARANGGRHAPSALRRRY
jgi:hypothetical protein